MTSRHYVQADRVSFAPGQETRPIVSDLSFTLGAGEALWIRGKNGSGKSTLLELICGSMTPLSGTLSVALSHSKIEYLPQMASPYFHIPMTLKDVVETLSLQSWDLDMLSSFELLEKKQLDLQWNTASGGEKKRTLLLASLLNHPQLLIIDEPLNHLDQSSKEIVENGLNRFMNQGKEKSIILVSHEELKSFQHPMHSIELKRSAHGLD